MDERTNAMLQLFQEAGGEAFVSEAAGAMFPWYDSHWLSYFNTAKSRLEAEDHEKLAEFIDAMSVFLVPADTKAPFLCDDILDAEVLATIRAEVAAQSADKLEKDELAAFGRDVVHDNPLLLELQGSIAESVSELAGEELEVSYNFLSLYRNDGRCPVHMDAPEAMWTLDICLDQSQEWPIYISETVEWPTESTPYETPEWEAVIKDSVEFKPFVMKPGQALLFAGSSQWHYRDPMPQATADDFCTLLFFHFIPKGAGELVNYRNWPKLFDSPGLLF